MTKAIEDAHAEHDDVVVFHLQTVFEGAHANTPERGPREAAKFDVEVPVGYDARVDGARVSLFMQRFGTGGTPWTTVVDKRGVVRFADFTPGEVGPLAELVERLRAEEVEEDEGGDDEGDPR